MIVNGLEEIELETIIKEKLTKNIAAYVKNLPESVRFYFLRQLDTDPQGLFIKFYLLTVAIGEPNTNLRIIIV